MCGHSALLMKVVFCKRIKKLWCCKLETSVIIKLRNLILKLTNLRISTFFYFLLCTPHKFLGFISQIFQSHAWKINLSNFLLFKLEIETHPIRWISSRDFLIIPTSLHHQFKCKCSNLSATVNASLLSHSQCYLTTIQINFAFLFFYSVTLAIEII